MSTHDRGWVKPVDGDIAGSMEPIEPTGRTLNSSVISGIIVVAIIVAAVAGTIMWRSRNGDPFSSAHSVPANMDFVVTFDALALSDSERLQSFVDAFAVPMVEAGVIEDYPDDLVAAIDEAMATETDFTLSADLLPWVGRSVSLAASVPEVDPATMEVDNLAFLLSADVRDRDGAAAFVDKVLGKMASHDLTVAAATIGGLPGYRWEESSGVSFGLVLTDESLLIGTEESVADAIAARDAGLSIADNSVFINTMGRLPDQRMVSFYMGGGVLEGLTNLATASTGMPSEQQADDLFDAVGVSLGLVDAGVEVNYVMAGVDGGTGSMTPDLGVLGSLPDDTLAFLSVAGASPDTQTVTDEMLGDMGDVIDQLSSEIGVDIAAVLGSLSGDLTIAVAESRDGLIADATDVPIAVVGALGLTDPGPVGDLMRQVEEMGAGPGVEYERSDGITTVVVDGAPVFSYSTGDDMFVAGMGPDLVAGVVSSSNGGLLDSALYRELDNEVLGDGLVGYVDIASIVDLVPLTKDEAAVFAPLRGIGYGGESSGDIIEMQVLILVDY
jgi:hypothetical protein